MIRVYVIIYMIVWIVIVCLYIRYDGLFFVFVLFFFKQKTAYEMRISDWSSDVCSSDLHGPARRLARPSRLRLHQFLRRGRGRAGLLSRDREAAVRLLPWCDRRSGLQSRCVRRRLYR